MDDVAIGKLFVLRTSHGQIWTARVWAWKPLSRLLIEGNWHQLVINTDTQGILQGIARNSKMEGCPEALKGASRDERIPQDEASMFSIVLWGWHTIDTTKPFTFALQVQEVWDNLGTGSGAEIGILFGSLWHGRWFLRWAGAVAAAMTGTNRQLKVSITRVSRLTSLQPTCKLGDARRDLMPWNESTNQGCFIFLGFSCLFKCQHMST